MKKKDISGKTSNALIYGLTALLCIVIVLFFIFGIYPKYKSQIDSQKRDMASRSSELASKQEIAKMAAERSQELESRKAYMAEQVTAYYGIDEPAELVIRDLREIFHQANVIPLEVRYDDDRTLSDDEKAIPAVSLEGESVIEMSSLHSLLAEESGPLTGLTGMATTETTTEAASTIPGQEALVKTSSTGPGLATIEPVQLKGHEMLFHFTFRTGFKNIKNLIKLVEEHPKKMFISNLSLISNIPINPDGLAIDPYPELEETADEEDAGIPPEIIKLRNEEKEMKKKGDKYEQPEEDSRLASIAVDLEITVLEPNFVHEFRTLQTTAIPEEDVLQPLWKDKMDEHGEPIEPAEVNPFSPVPWYDDWNDEVWNNKES